MKKKIIIQEAKTPANPYVSNYLNVDDPDARQTFWNKLNDDKVIDVDSFHRGFDKELNSLGLFGQFQGEYPPGHLYSYYLFDQQGTLLHKSYAKLKELHTGKKDTDTDAITATWKLWIAMYSANPKQKLPFESDAVAKKAAEEKARKEKEDQLAKQRNRQQQLDNIEKNLSNRSREIANELQKRLSSNPIYTEIKNVVGQIDIVVIVSEHFNFVNITVKFASIKNSLLDKEPRSSVLLSSLYERDIYPEDDPNLITTDLIYDEVLKKLESCEVRIKELKVELAKNEEVVEFLDRPEFASTKNKNSYDLYHFVFYYDFLGDYYEIKINDTGSSKRYALEINPILGNKIKVDYNTMKDDMKLVAAYRNVLHNKSYMPGNGDHEYEDHWSLDSDSVSDEFINQYYLKEHSGNFVAGSSYEEISGFKARKLRGFIFPPGFDTWGISREWSQTYGD